MLGSGRTPPRRHSGEKKKIRFRQVGYFQNSLSCGTLASPCLKPTTCSPNKSFFASLHYAQNDNYPAIEAVYKEVNLDYFQWFCHLS
jgi:hypothetical protein